MEIGYRRWAPSGDTPTIFIATISLVPGRDDFDEFYGPAWGKSREKMGTAALITEPA